MPVGSFSNLFIIFVNFSERQSDLYFSLFPFLSHSIFTFRCFSSSEQIINRLGNKSKLRALICLPPFTSQLHMHSDVHVATLAGCMEPHGACGQCLWCSLLQSVTVLVAFTKMVACFSPSRRQCSAVIHSLALHSGPYYTACKKCLVVEDLRCSSLELADCEMPF